MISVRQCRLLDCHSRYDNGAYRRHLEYADAAAGAHQFSHTHKLTNVVRQHIFSELIRSVLFPWVFFYYCTYRSRRLQVSIVTCLLLLSKRRYIIKSSLLRDHFWHCSQPRGCMECNRNVGPWVTYRASASNHPGRWYSVSAVMCRIGCMPTMLRQVDDLSLGFLQFNTRTVCIYAATTTDLIIIKWYFNQKAIQN